MMKQRLLYNGIIVLTAQLVQIAIELLHSYLGGEAEVFTFDFMLYYLMMGFVGFFVPYFIFYCIYDLLLITFTGRNPWFMKIEGKVMVMVVLTVFTVALFYGYDFFCDYMHIVGQGYGYFFREYASFILFSPILLLVSILFNRWLVKKETL